MAAKKYRATLGLGSNIGDRAGHIESALEMLESLDRVTVVRRSSIYQSDAHVLDPNDVQHAYLNAACLIETSLSPKELLDACLAVESAHGRVRSEDERWQSRTLDIDILHFGDVSVKEPNLVIPHPHLPARRFVLTPLFEIAPDLKIPPPFDQTVQYLLEHCPDDGPVTRYPADQAANSKV